MRLIRFYGLIAFLAGVLLTPTAMAAEPGLVSGTITSINTSQKAITVRGDRNRARRTYFVTPETRLSAGGNNVSLGDLKVGQQVELRFRETDAGRNALSMTVPTPARVMPVDTEMSSARMLEGTVTNVSRQRRTMTVRDASTRERTTLQILEDTPIRDGSRRLALRDISRGDRVAVEYRETNEGLVIGAGTPAVAAAAPAPIRVLPPVTVARDQPAALPKTDGQNFLWLWAGLLAIGLAAVSRLSRAQRG